MPLTVGFVLKTFQEISTLVDAMHVSSDRVTQSRMNLNSMVRASITTPSLGSCSILQARAYFNALRWIRNRHK